MIRKTLPLFIAGLAAAFISTAVPAADDKAAPTSGGSTRGTVKGGSDYERTMQQAGMSGMSGMSGDRNMTAQKAGEKAAPKAKKKKAAKKKAAAPAAAK